MDEVYEYCVRMLGAGSVAIHASHEAFVAGGSDRLARLAGAVRACRDRAGEEGPGVAVEGRGVAVEGRGAAVEGRGVAAEDEPSAPSGKLADAVAREVADAASELSPVEREALALRELVGLSHDELARALEIDAGEVAPLIARARLSLRANRRGIDPGEREPCADRDRALAIMTRRQDREAVSLEDEDWLLEHLGSCESCPRLHAAMLEASVCYRAWRIPDPASTRPGVLARVAGSTVADAVGEPAQ